MIIEGVDDPRYPKMCFHGKGDLNLVNHLLIMEIFGIDKKLKSSFSSFGLKSVNSDSYWRLV